MNTPILVGICAAILLGTAEASAEQQGKSPKSSADNNTPKSIACAQERGAPLGQCSFKRALFFMDRKFLKASVTMSGVGTDTDWSLKDETHIIRVDGQRYEVPNILIAGN